MMRKVLMLLGAGFVLNMTGCAVFSLLMIPIEFVLSILGFVWDGVGTAVDAVAYVEPIEGVAPTIERLDDGRFRVAGVDPGARFDLVCESPGLAPRRYSFPVDGAEIVRGPEGRAELTCVLVPFALGDPVTPAIRGEMAR